MKFNLSMTAFQWGVLTAVTTDCPELSSGLAAGVERLGDVASDVWRSVELTPEGLDALVAQVEAACDDVARQDAAAAATESTRGNVEAELLCDVLLRHVKSEVEFCAANGYAIPDQIIV